MFGASSTIFEILAALAISMPSAHLLWPLASASGSCPASATRQPPTRDIERRRSAEHSRHRSMRAIKNTADLPALVNRGG
jgi:hypothetical protein